MTTPDFTARDREIVELLPCPFCSGGARSVIGAAADGHYVMCIKCDAPSAMRSTPAEAIAAWNRRALRPSDVPGLGEDAEARDARIRKALTDAASALRYCMAHMPLGDPLARKIELTEAEARAALSSEAGKAGGEKGTP